jgi:hypothetical protein
MKINAGIKYFQLHSREVIQTDQKVKSRRVAGDAATALRFLELAERITTMNL